MPLARDHDLPHVAKARRGAGGERRRRHRIRLARQEQRRPGGVEGRVQVGVDGALRPAVAERHEPVDLLAAEVGRGERGAVGVAERRHVLGAADGEVHAEGDLVVEARAEQQQLRRERREVVPRGAVEQQRQQRCRGRVVVEQPDGARERSGVEVELLRRPGRRVGDRQVPRSLRELRAQRLEAARELREGPRAGGVGAAAGEGEVERALRRERRVREEARVGRQHAVEHDGGDARRVAAHVVLRDPCAVGDAVQADALEAERGAHRVEVLDRDARRVELRPAGEAAAAGRRQIARARRRRRRDVEVRRQLAREPVRAAGAALVDEHDVVVALHRREVSGVREVEVGARPGRDRPR